MNINRFFPATAVLLITQIMLFHASANAQENDKNKAREILLRAVQAAGGLDAFKAIDNFVISTQSDIYGSQSDLHLSITETAVLPDKTKQEFVLPAGTRVQILNGDNSWKELNGTVVPLSETEKREMERGLFRDMTNLFRQADSPDLIVEYIDEETVGGIKSHILQIKNESNDFFNIYIDATSFLVKKIAYQGAAEAGLATLEEIYSDYQTVGGVKIPFQRTVKANGRKFIESVIVEARFNEKLDSEFFFKK